ncbi:cupin domain-containing protein [Sphingomonas sp. BK580]|uniref:cupin domain-containing protein n=1 Tax=Sphingomonas sp. BK580 TaxID=2586972 RepID=UPI0017ACAE36|nr:cupin domain-containing protein [Sphingomonas sp. BK580]MBB3691858.1 putative cupin superfamily protein [Sphingomonas sp. BK580]
MEAIGSLARGAALLTLAWAATATARQAPAPRPLAARIGHTDPARYRQLAKVHDGAGTMAFAPLLGADALSTNLIFVHRGVIPPHSGIGQHFHHQCEEMFVILDGEAQFTVDGRTAALAGPVAVPDRMGHAHALYNASDRPVQWLNINVGQTKRYDNLDLGDSREGAPLDRVAQFAAVTFDRDKLRPQGNVRTRRLLGPEVFTTPWAFVDHVLVPAGAALDGVAAPGISEMVYVIAGAGEAQVAGERAPLRTGDALPVEVGAARTLRATGAAPLELLVVGVARDLAAKAEYAASLPPR